MLSGIPLMIVPLALFNLALAGLVTTAGADPWIREIAAFHMMSGGNWRISYGDLLILFSLVLLFFEIVKATRTSTVSVIDHVLSTFVFVIFLVEFLLVRQAGNSLFFILMMMALIDVLAGFSVSLRAASRDVSIH